MVEDYVAANVFAVPVKTGVKSAMVVADTQGGDNHATIRIGEGAITPNYCGSIAGTQFAVSTFDLNAPADKGFSIWFFN